MTVTIFSIKDNQGVLVAWFFEKDLAQKFIEEFDMNMESFEVDNKTTVTFGRRISYE